MNFWVGLIFVGEGYTQSTPVKMVDGVRNELRNPIPSSHQALCVCWATWSPNPDGWHRLRIMTWITLSFFTVKRCQVIMDVGAHVVFKIEGQLRCSDT